MGKFSLREWMRADLLNLAPYSTARHELGGRRATVFLDANENSRGSSASQGLNRYPDPRQQLLKEELARLKSVSPESIFLGNGSDEAIDLLVRLGCAAGESEVLVLEPSYGMYCVAAATQGASLVTVPLGPDYALSAAAVLAAVTPRTKLVFLCSPNNPTGNLLERSEILHIVRQFSGLVVVDEAYIEFAPPGSSLLPEVSRHENLVVLHTLSKAWGLAGARVGMAFAAPELVEMLSRIKLPYNLSALAQRAALTAIQNLTWVEQCIAEVAAERTRIAAALSALPCSRRVFPSQANFLLWQVADADAVYSALLDDGIVVRNRNSARGCEGSLRISIGTEYENDRMIAALQRYCGMTPEARSVRAAAASDRRAEVRRATAETAVQVAVDLDGQGRSQIETGLGFFDHMLHQIARHSGVDIELIARGDLHVDEHHTIEDVGIALGEALSQAFGDKRGIERYGFSLPMDEARATVLLDLSGRSVFRWQVPLKRERVGDLPCEMVQHFFASLSNAMRATLHIDAEGENDHHVIEGVFKGFARALRSAVRRDGRNSGLPSTKEVL